MDKALELAKKSLGRTSPNPLVGAVIVKNNQIVGQGYHQRVGTAHGERVALEEAGDLAKGADLYVTLEPCNHFGRTPPCTKAIIEAGIKKVYVASIDPNPLVSGKGIEALQRAGIEVEVGLREKEAQELNEVFFKYITTKLPFIALKAACSLDGKIATRNGHSKWITGEEARKHSHGLRNIYDAIMVGKGTVLADDPQLNCRIPGGRDPIRIVVDSKLSISPKAKILNLTSTAPTIIATTKNAPIDKIKVLASKGEIIQVNEGDQVDLLQLFKILGERKITSILVEGGGILNASIVSQGLMDKLYLYLAPILIGGQEAPGFIGGAGISKLQEALRLGDINIEKIGQDILITGKVIDKWDSSQVRLHDSVIV